MEMNSEGQLEMEVETDSNGSTPESLSSSNSFHPSRNEEKQLMNSTSVILRDNKSTRSAGLKSKLPEKTVVFTPTHKRGLPLGIRLIQKCSNWCPNQKENRGFRYRVLVLVLTYLSYTSYILSRKPMSIVKNLLNRNCSLLKAPPNVGNSTTWCQWPPFDGENSRFMVSAVDNTFPFVYAIGLFASGFVAERVNIRYFISVGMLLSGIFAVLFGVGRCFRVPFAAYFFMMQILGAIVHTSGWPGVITVMANWFGKGKRGLIFGIWNSHVSVGNILGSLIASTFVDDDWGLSFIIPGIIVGTMSFIVFLFLVPTPEQVHCSVPMRRVPRADGNKTDPSNAKIELDRSRKYMKMDGVTQPTQNPSTSSCNDECDTDVKIKAVGFSQALRIPGVLEFSFCLFFAKLVSFTFVSSLPRYINNSTNFSIPISGYMSTFFDLGGVIGAVVAGAISDYSGMSATTCAGMLAFSIPMMLVYQNFSAQSVEVGIILLILVGILVNGPYAFITTAVSTELGTHPSLKGNSRALATVAAIIDGTGALGAAIGPFVTGTVADVGGWRYVLVMLMTADVIALILLIRLVSHEVRHTETLGDIKLSVKLTAGFSYVILLAFICCALRLEMYTLM